MSYLKKVEIDSPVGRRETDYGGSPVGVARIDVDKSYAGIGELLRDYIDRSDEAAWEKIKAKIDYTYESLDLAMAPLEAETGFSKEINARVGNGQKLLFKPNLVMPSNIDPQTHGPGAGSTTCTEWPFIAALMRWFHDKLGISYYQMTVGEAATAMSASAGLYSLLNPSGEQVTTEAVIEGKAGDFYGGWGFYFARKYLVEELEPSSGDDPMSGHEESVAGTYIPPGLVSDKLMVYDLNRIYDDDTKGRKVEVPGGANFSSITLHKAIVGGDPDDPEDREVYPGCVLINVPKFKVHSQAMFTNVIKNLGIGLYPMQSSTTGDCRWQYAVPHNPTPGLKGGIPHQVWVPELDEETDLPSRDDNGDYIVKKTGGMPATMVDIIKAVQAQDIIMAHVVDGIEAINFDHTGSLPGIRKPEGMVFAGLNPVALDLLCARYMFSNVPFEEALNIDLDDGAGGSFPQKVPMPAVEGNVIVTETGYDCPLSRDVVFEYAEKRGLGGRSYYVVGQDAETEDPIISIDGHLGTVTGGAFSDLVTETLFFAAFKFPWDMQQTAFNYLEAVDELMASSLKKEFLGAFDEDGDGVVSYDEYGRKGIFGPLLHLTGAGISRIGTEPFGFLRGPFSAAATLIKCANPAWNQDGHNFNEEYFYGRVCWVAYLMSQSENEAEDPFHPSLTWGKGKWPSFDLALHHFRFLSVYGAGFPDQLGLTSLYGYAFRYADLTQNEGRLVGSIASQPQTESIHRYMTEVQSGKMKPLDFTLHLPPGLSRVNGSKALNIEETTDPGKILTASFNGGEEIWPVHVKT